MENSKDKNRESSLPEKMVTNDSIAPEVEISEDCSSSEVFHKPKDSLSNSEMPDTDLERNKSQELENFEKRPSPVNLDKTRNTMSVLEMPDTKLERNCQETETFEEQLSPKKLVLPEDTLPNSEIRSIQLDYCHESSEEQPSLDTFDKPKTILSNLEMLDSSPGNSIGQEMDTSKEQKPPTKSDDLDSLFPPFETADSHVELDTYSNTKPTEEQENPGTTLSFLETPDPQVEQDISMESNEEHSLRKLDKPKNSLPYFEMPNPDLEQFILETSETLAVASKPLASKEQSVPQKKVFLKPYNEECITFDIVEPIRPIDKFKSKFISQIQNKRKECSEPKTSEPKLINFGEEIAPGSKHLVLRETLRKKIAEKKFIHLKEKRMFQEEVSDNSSDGEDEMNDDDKDIGDDEVPEQNGSVLENMPEESQNSNDVDPCFLALKKPEQHDMDDGPSHLFDEAVEKGEDEDELDDFYSTSNLSDADDNMSSKETRRNLPSGDFSDSDTETDHVSLRKKCRPLADLSDDESVDNDPPIITSYKAAEDENSKTSLSGNHVSQSQTVDEQLKGEPFSVETDDEGNMSISDIPSYQPNGGFRFQDSFDKYSQDSGKTSQSSDGKNVPNFMIPSFVPLKKTLNKTPYSCENRTGGEDSQNGSSIGLKGLDNLCVDGDDSQSSYDDVVPICSGSFKDGSRDGKITQPVIADSNGFKCLDKHLVREGSQNSYDDVVPICSGSFKDVSTNGKITQPVTADSKDSQKEISNGFKCLDKLLVRGGSQNSYDDVVPICSGSFNDVTEDAEIAHPKAIPEQPTTKVWDYFDDEAELSGEDQGSDGDSEDELAAEIEDEFEVTEEVLEESEEQRRKAAELFMKRLRDDDVQDIRDIKERFLEGELGDQSGRSRKFVWSKAGAGDIPLPNQGDSSSDSENENDADVTVKWNLNVEKTKWQMQSQDETAENAIIEIETLSSQGKISKTGMLGMTRVKTNQNFRKRTRGSAFSMDESLLKKFKLEEIGS